MDSTKARFDVFVSHANEDKDTIARPLAQKLVELGLRVWFDEFNLQIGDKLRESIDHGLSRSNFGVVIVSKNFFSNNWTKMELEALIILYVRNITKILPVWHGVESHDVIDFSPMLASIIALSSSSGIDIVASKIYKAITDKSVASEIGIQYESPLQVEVFDQSPVHEIQNIRFRFILKLYEKRDRRFIKNNAYEIGQELGYTKETTDEILRYFEDKGYLEYPINGPFVEVTTTGIDYIESLIPTAREVKKIQSARKSVLKELYKEKTSYWGLNMWDLGNKLDFPDEAATEDVIHYLHVNGLVEFPTLGPFVKITTYGIDYYEGFIASMDSP